MREEGSREALSAQIHVIGTAKSVESKPAGKVKKTKPVEQFKKKKKLTKKEKKDFYKVFTELIQEHSDEVGWWEPTAYHRGMWKAECILKKLLEEW